MEPYASRWKRARDVMEREGIGALLLTPSSDFYYMTGYPAKPTERFTAFILPLEGDPVLVTPAFELARIGNELRHAAVCRTWEEKESPIKLTAELLDTQHEAIGAGDEMWSVFLLALQDAVPNARWLPSSRVVPPLRMVKDEAELRLLREAQQIAERVLQQLLDHGLEGKTERQAAQLLTALRQEAGLDPAGSAGTVGGGPNGASPHHINTDRVIHRGDAVVIDFSGAHHGYRADITRTPHVGPAPQEFREVYQTVFDANAAAFTAIRPGAPCESVDLAGRRVIADAGYGRYFTHRLGHGLGLDVHEPPYIVEGNSLRLGADMVFTDEPGIYLPDRFGVRIEDVVRVTAVGAERLTNYPRELLEID
jgi:Xaa-Pro aminopeptidase